MAWRNSGWSWWGSASNLIGQSSPAIGVPRLGPRLTPVRLTALLPLLLTDPIIADTVRDAGSAVRDLRIVVVEPGARPAILAAMTRVNNQGMGPPDRKLCLNNQYCPPAAIDSHCRKAKNQT